MVKICSAFSIVLLAATTVGLSACVYTLSRSEGGGQAPFSPPRVVDSAQFALPEGYRVEPVATRLTFPTDVAVDAAGRVYVIEAGYSYGEVWTTPQLLRVEPGGRTTAIARGARNGPWTGVTLHDGEFYIAEGGELRGGRILRVAPDGEVTPLVENLPTRGDHHTNGPEIGPEGEICFGVGTATNSGVVGVDSAQYG
jgi:hypothetical protein